MSSICEASICEEFLDLERREEDPLLKKREELHTEIERASPDRVQEILRLLRPANPQSEGCNK